MNADIFGLLGSYVEGQLIPARQISSSWRYSALRHQEEVIQELENKCLDSSNIIQSIIDVIQNNNIYLMGRIFSVQWNPPLDWEFFIKDIPSEEMKELFIRYVPDMKYCLHLESEKESTIEPLNRRILMNLILNRDYRKLDRYLEHYKTRVLEVISWRLLEELGDKDPILYHILHKNELGTNKTVGSIMFGASFGAVIPIKLKYDNLTGEYILPDLYAYTILVYDNVGMWNKYKDNFHNVEFLPEMYGSIINSVAQDHKTLQRLIDLVIYSESFECREGKMQRFWYELLEEIKRSYESETQEQDVKSIVNLARERGWGNILMSLK